MALQEDLSTLELIEPTSGEKDETLDTILEMYAKARSLYESIKNDPEDLPSDELLCNHEIKLCFERMQEMRNTYILSSGVRCLNPNSLKQQLCNSTQSKERLKTNIAATGLWLYEEIAGDGNCFFRAVSSQLHRIGETDVGYHDLRAQVVASLRTNTLIQVEDVQVDLADFMTGSTHEYCDRMSQDGEWADHVCVMATAHYLHRDILIVTSSPDAGPENIISWIAGKPGFTGDPLLLGHVWEKHYESLTPNERETKADGHNTTQANIDNDSKADRFKSTTQSSLQALTHDKKDQVTHDPDAAFKAVILKHHCRNHPKEGIDIKRLQSDVTEEDFTCNYLEELYSRGKGRFSYPEHRSKGTIQYYCERHGKPRGKKRGPKQTRCNGCPAYVSFKYVELNGMKGVIIRSNLEHAGHNLHDPEERHVAALHPDLVSLIQSLAEEKTSAQIVTACLAWANEHGHGDLHDRRFYPLPRDVQQVIAAYKLSQRYHPDDSVAVGILCTHILKDKIIFYQPLDRSKNQSLIIVYQDDKQRERMTKYGKQVVFLDATYKGITSYGYAFYALIAKTDTGHGTPLFYIISSEDSIPVLAKALQSVKDTAEKRKETFYPMSFMVDKDVKEHQAINAVFPLANIILCWFHVLQAIYRWLNKHDSGISGADNAETRRGVINYIRKMKNCTELSDFLELGQQLDDEMPTPAVATYLKNNWVPCGKMWANYGRRVFHGDHETNNLAERFFLGLKYHHLARQANKRVDDLLIKLSAQVNPTYDYLEALGAIGRLGNKKASRKGKRTDDLVQSMLQQGWQEKTWWVDDMCCLIPSQQNVEDVYRVDLPHGTCECIAASQEGHCKHYRLALILASLADMNVEEARVVKARKLYEDGSFLQADGSIEVYDDHVVGYVQIESRRCVCVAFSHGIECICVKVAAMVCPPSDTLQPSAHHETEPSYAHEDNRDETTVQQLQNMLKAFEGQGCIANKRKAADYIDSAYKAMYCTHTKKTNAKKIYPLVTGRKISKRKRESHSFAPRVNKAKKSKRLADGGARMTNR